MFDNATTWQKTVILLTRVILGWMFLYAGMTHITDPTFSAAGYLNHATTFHWFYAWLAQPGILPITNFINEWGLTLLGLSLIFGLFVRLSGWLGAVMMVLYYFPILKFPTIPPHYYLVDDHIIYAIMLIFIATFNLGGVWGLDAVVKLSQPAQGKPKKSDK